MTLSKIKSYHTTIQSGYGGMPIFRSQSYQRGYGFGGWGRALLKSIAPIAKRGLLSLGKATLSAGARSLEDIGDNNTTVKDAFKKRAIQTFHPSNVINRAMKKRKAANQLSQSKRKVARRKPTPKGRTISDVPSLSR